jgi:hypothetical protein
VRARFCLDGAGAKATSSSPSEARKSIVFAMMNSFAADGIQDGGWEKDVSLKRSQRRKGAKCATEPRCLARTILQGFSSERKKKCGRLGTRSVRNFGTVRLGAWAPSRAAPTRFLGGHTSTLSESRVVAPKSEQKVSVGQPTA